MVVRENAGNDDDSGQYNAQIQIVVGRLFAGARLNRVGDEAEYGADPQQHRKATKQVLAEFNPFGCLFGGRQRVRAVALQVLLGLGVTKTLKNRNGTINICLHGILEMGSEERVRGDLHFRDVFEIVDTTLPT